MLITDDVKKLVEIAINEDLGRDKIDITSNSTIDSNATITAHMISREEGIIAGTEIVEYVFNCIAPSAKVTIHLQDGDKVKAQDKILTVNGNAQDILKSERIALNFITHLSGISTKTAKYVAAISHTNTKILDTRKTLPGWRSLQKHAVKMGGGTNHRMGLYDIILIKDNHIAATRGIDSALDCVKQANPQVKIEIEVDTLEQLQEVLNHDTAEIVLLDNMPPSDLKTAVEMCAGKLTTEASGSVNIDSVKTIAESGVDYISIGALTHSVKVFDIGLDIE